MKLYEQIKQHLLDGITAGRWAEGAKIPSEHDLMATFNASRMTVHRAVRELSADGLLNRLQGAGSFVRRQAPRSALLEIHDIAEDIRARGHAHGSHILQLTAIRADAALATELDLRRGARVFHSQIVHTEDGIPVQLEERYISPHFAPDYLAQDFSAQTTSRYLQTIAQPTEVEHVVHAVTADAHVQTLLEIGPAEPCLAVLRRTWTASGPATRSLLTHPGSRYSLGSRYAVK
jgi:GntR family histidine utilization transcriptional repressor